MTTKRLIAKLRISWRQFARAKEGNTLVIFALAFIPMLGLTGAAVDYSHASLIKTSMQSAGDTAALAIAQSATTATPADLQTAGDNYYRALFKRTDVHDLNVTATYSNTNGSTVVITATAIYDTSIMGVMGPQFRHLPISITSTSSWGTSRLRVALVLDNTGSMADAGKMTALKTAAKNLIGQLRTAAVTNGDVYVSIIPFSKDVNVGGTSNWGANWLNWKLWDPINAVYGPVTPVTVCFQGFFWTSDGQNPPTRGSSCTVPTTTACFFGTLYTFTATSYAPTGTCPYTPPAVTNHNTWNGCITDRDQDYDIGNTVPNPLDINLLAGVASSLFPTEQYDSCPTPMMGLSYDWTALNSKIDAMSPAGNTNQAIGLAWGWQSLTQGDPLNAPAETGGYQYQKVIILLTDGLNTQNRWTSNSAQIDTRQTTLCNNIKNAGITLYTIQVNTGSDPTSTMLRNCASDVSKSFVLTQATQIVQVFNQIGTNLSKLHIAR